MTLAGVPAIADYLMILGRLEDSTGQANRYHAFLRDHGRAWRVDADTFRGKRMPPHRCFGNAADLLIRGRRGLRHDLVYVEGLLSTMGIPLAHAWLGTPEGTVIDPTIRPGMADDAALEYFGVPFTFDYLAEVLVRTGTYGVIEMNRPLLTGEEDWGIAP